ncbi:hypothetical protein NFIA_066980 [Paecilomyces variotii No. 5]|uniref:Ribonuclease H2 subunit B n=1 Tax=Byssochlamys spectabilis (strain No. 5 / NBRC 109023) TaxID=1356009 RepID=V5FMB7_BYSSN|nr:hypothetical protein NFIA_066980 [Paecilomyces variotii No. 5]
MRTRANGPKGASSEDKPETEQQPSKKTLTPAERPSKAFILPSKASSDARFLTLPNPSTGELNRYFFCPQLGLYEFTVVASQPQIPRSILFTQKNDNNASTKVNGAGKRPEALLTKTAELFIATPIDCIFFILPILAPPASKTNSAKGLFQPLDDILDSQDELHDHLRYIFYNESFRGLLEKRMESICDTVEAGDEKMFRLSEEKLLKELISKAERMVAQGLPKSLEERFISQALETPLLSVKRDDVVTAETKSDNDNTPAAESQETPELERAETQSSAATAGTSISTPLEASTPVTQLSAIQSPSPDDSIPRLLRVRTALSFMQSSYLPPHISAKIGNSLVSPESPIDFKPLTDELKRIADLRAEALASRSFGDFSRKRSAEDDEIDAAESRAEKKRRKEEEEKKKKAGLSRGVKDLKKVDTSGMKKMSDFFGKAAAKKKS